MHEASNQRRWWTRHKGQEVTLDEWRRERRGRVASRVADMLAAVGGVPFDDVARAGLRERVEAALQQDPGGLPDGRGAARD